MTWKEVGTFKWIPFGSPRDIFIHLILLTSSDRLHSLSVPQIPHLQNGTNTRISYKRLTGWNIIISIIVWNYSWNQSNECLLLSVLKNHLWNHWFWRTFPSKAFLDKEGVSKVVSPPLYYNNLSSCGSVIPACWASNLEGGMLPSFPIAWNSLFPRWWGTGDRACLLRLP